MDVTISANGLLAIGFLIGFLSGLVSVATLVMIVAERSRRTAMRLMEAERQRQLRPPVRLQPADPQPKVEP
jgi:hypothetical protein